MDGEIGIDIGGICNDDDDIEDDTDGDDDDDDDDNGNDDDDVIQTSRNIWMTNFDIASIL